MTTFDELLLALKTKQEKSMELQERQIALEERKLALEEK